MPGPLMMASIEYSQTLGGSFSGSFEDTETESEVDAQLKEARELVASLDKLEVSCQNGRERVKAAAARLIYQIKEHEQRLLEEIDVHRQTELKKVPVDQATLRTLAEKLEQLKHKGNTPEDCVNDKISEEKKLSLPDSGEDAGSGLGLDSVRRLVAAAEKQLSPGELVLSEMGHVSHGLLGWLAGYDLQEIRCVTFVPIRCNTAFGTVEAEEGSPGYESGRRSRSVSLLGSSNSNTDQLSLSPERNISLHRSRSLRVSRSPSPRHFSAHSSDQLCPLDAMDGTSRLRRHHSMKMPKDLNHLSTRHAWSPLSTRRMPASSCSPSREVPEAFSLLWQLTDTDRFNSPTDVVFLPNGDLAVADRNNERIQVIDWKRGSVIHSIGQGKIRPQRLAVTPDGHLAVTDLKSCCIKIFSLDGRIVSSWGRKRFKSAFHSPCGLAINSQGQFIVSDMEKQTVSVHQPDGKLVRLLGTHSEFHSPAYVAASRRDSRIVVADNWTNTVKVYSADGEWLFQLDDLQAEGSRLDYPNGVCVDECGDVLVAEWGKHRLSRFTDNGRFMHHLLTRNDGVHYPAGIAIRADLLAETEYSDSHSVVRLFQLNKRLV